MQHHTRGEFQPVVPIVSSSQAYQPEETEGKIFHPAAEQSVQETTEVSEEVEEAYVPLTETHVEEEQKKHYSAWDASKLVEVLPTLRLQSLNLHRAPPPADSKPEAHNFPSTHYTMSSDPTPFKAPERYPDPPNDMYYEVPKTPTYQKPAPIFPWEKNAAKPTRVFPEDNIDVTESFRASPSISTLDTDVDDNIPAVTLSTSNIHVISADPWQTFTRGNAWDDVPEIQNYIGNLQKNRKGNIQVLQGYGSGIEQVSSLGTRRHNMRLTDFPTELERPSLPVTPAPIRRPSFWGEERDEDGELPAAEGVPSQEDWVSLILFLSETDSRLPSTGSNGPTGTARAATIRCSCNQAWDGWWTITGDSNAAITLWLRGCYVAHLQTAGAH